MNDVFCTCIIPTIGRESLARAVYSVLAQTPSAEFEIIVVNDSGNALPHQPWQKSPKVQVINTSKRERSVARNTGAALARGHFLHFLDDDDWIAEKAYRHLLELSHMTESKWLYGKTQLLDRENNPTIVLEQGMNGNCFIQSMAGEWIPLQSSLIDRILFWEIGGFNPLLAGPEDIDLQRRTLLKTDIAETPHIIGHVIRGENGSTTDYLQHAQQNRWAREAILDSKSAFRRMYASATSPMWHGRTTRMYLTSVVRNLQHLRFFTMIHRFIFACLSILFAGKNIFAREFWWSVFRSYKSVTFERGIRDAGQNKVNSA